MFPLRSLWLAPGVTVDKIKTDNSREVETVAQSAVVSLQMVTVKLKWLVSTNIG